jgi:hypothetical protein
VLHIGMEEALDRYDLEVVEDAAREVAAPAAARGSA